MEDFFEIATLSKQKIKGRSYLSGMLTSTLQVLVVPNGREHTLYIRKLRKKCTLSLIKGGKQQDDL
jgi:hypothetical protein